eukprot:TRINITY_DN22_c0_g1_i1.p2 TRINITY_DN22_c0_g1~~TRINITY_DN22_c0_g1_i1.p2  ORF type:complete len:158 (+),score=63.98 TRINITY_DN22_c0_g1_i1:127-600(+)
MSNAGNTVKDIDPQEFVIALAKYLKRSGKIRVPKYAEYAKTGHYKTMPPNDPDWFFIRTAALARRVYMRGGVGVGWLSRAIGTAASAHRTPRHRVKAAHGNIRHALQALETLGMVQKDKEGGRSITSAGRRDLDRIAVRLAKSRKTRRALTMTAPKK